MLEKPHLNFTHQATKSRGIAAGRQEFTDILVHGPLRILRLGTHRLIEGAVQRAAASGHEGDAGIAPQPVELLGQRLCLRGVQCHQSVRRQPHAAHGGDIVHRCGNEYRCAVHAS